jgi:hypothetical protein
MCHLRIPPATLSSGGADSVSASQPGVLASGGAYSTIRFVLFVDLPLVRLGDGVGTGGAAGVRLLVRTGRGLGDFGFSTLAARPSGERRRGVAVDWVAAAARMDADRVEGWPGVVESISIP